MAAQSQPQADTTSLQASSPSSAAAPSSAMPESNNNGNNTPQKKRPSSIDLWNVPSLVQPSPPSNTLLITNLQSPHIFAAASLQNLYNLLNEPVALNSFAPLPSLRRIIISYPTTEAAIATRQLLEQSTSLPTPPQSQQPDTKLPSHNDQQEHQQQQQQQQQQQPKGSQTHATTTTTTTTTTSISPQPAMKIYFGEPTPLVGQYASADSTDSSQHLQAPSLGKLMFISPPPSPPCGWEMREEDPPNKMTHAEDLLAALTGLGSRQFSSHNNTNNNNHNDDDDEENNEPSSITKPFHAEPHSPISPTSDNPFTTDLNGTAAPRQSSQGRLTPTSTSSTRPRRSTLTVYHPRDHGDSEDLPAVMVEDMTGEADATAPEEVGPLPTRTSRPPVELMDVC